MNNKIIDIYNFSCPRWDDLPDNIASSEIIEYFKEKFSDIFLDDDLLTKTMIQNYVKWKMVPAPTGRKYNREQIAIIIVICIFKQVLSIKEIVDGVYLQNKLMEIPMAYNILAEKIEKAIKSIFGPIINNDKENIYFEKYIANTEDVGISSLVISFTFKLLTSIIIQERGFKSLI